MTARGTGQVSPMRVALGLDLVDGCLTVPTCESACRAALTMVPLLSDGLLQWNTLAINPGQLDTGYLFCDYLFPCDKP